ncbi:uncharacterized protein [Callorhinus ursinus]|uniref:uncharacterized protein isoform X2 n=1 Tax=Callorhinus ursinus TaxID=34884 RepID=UPI003CD04FAA
MTFLKISFVNAAPVFSCHLLLQHFYDEVRGFYKNKFPGGPENPEVLITLGPHFCKATQLELPQRKSFPSGYINRKKPRDLLGSRSSVSEEKTSWFHPRSMKSARAGGAVAHAPGDYNVCLQLRPTGLQDECWESACEAWCGRYEKGEQSCLALRWKSTKWERGMWPAESARGEGPNRVQHGDQEWPAGRHY